MGARLPSENAGNPVIVGHLSETVAAEQKPVAVDEFHALDDGADVFLRTAERARQYVTKAMARDFMLADQVHCRRAPGRGSDRG